MFTGIVEETGRVARLSPTPSGTRFAVSAGMAREGTKTGDSVAVNGCCLTVVGMGEGTLEFDLLAETQARTNLAALAVGAAVNLERSVPSDGRMGGHFVSGHIDTASPILVWEPRGADWVLDVAVPEAFSRYMVSKGCVAVDGISLTVAELLPGGARFWIIPHTRAVTALGERKPGDLVNLEFDLLAKYVERILGAGAARIQT